MANIKLSYGRPEGVPFDVVVHQYSDSQFGRLTRSTIPFLCYWKDYKTILPRLCKEVSLTRGSVDGLLSFEYPVSSLGRNTPSFTDLMYISKDNALGIEAKSTEAEYDIVEVWLRKGKKPENRRGVLNHWISLIEAHTGTKVRRDSIGEVVNQMLHRAASVCSLRKPHSAVLYQWFNVMSISRKPKVNYLRGLQKLAEAINAGERLSIWFQEVTADPTEEPTEEYHRVEQEASRAKAPDRPRIIRSAILNNKPLFSFQATKPTRVRAKECEPTHDQETVRQRN